MYLKSILTLYVITFACLSYAPVTLSQADSKTSNSTSQIENQLKQIDAAYFRNYLVMQKGGDRTEGVEFFERLIADDYFNIDENGNLSHKAGRIATIRNPNLITESNGWTDMQVRLYGDTALVYSNFSFRAKSNGKLVSGSGIHAHWYQKRNGQWLQVAALGLPASNQSTGEPSSLKKMDVALRAFKHWQRGFQTGDFAPYLAMTADNFLFWFPAGKQRGQFSGAAGKMQMVAKARSHTEAKDRLNLKPYRITTSNNTVVFEFDAEGTINGKPYKGRNIISLDIEGEKISGFREYFGDLGV